MRKQTGPLSQRNTAFHAAVPPPKFKAAPSFNVLCTPLQPWRPDDASLHPHCVDCKNPILTGDKYRIIDRVKKPNQVVCVPCTMQV